MFGFVLGCFGEIHQGMCGYLVCFRGFFQSIMFYFMTYFEKIDVLEENIQGMCLCVFILGLGK